MKLEDFLSKLELEVEVTPVTPAQVEHVAELLTHSAEFNLDGRSHTADEITSLVNADPARCFAVQVRDRFGDYGAAGALLLSYQGDVLSVDGMALNCRVLGKGVEQETLRQIQERARAHGASRVELHYRRTPRNSAAFLFIQTLGGHVLDESAPAHDIVLTLQASIHVDEKGDGGQEKKSSAPGFSGLLGEQLQSLDPNKRERLLEQMQAGQQKGRLVLQQIRRQNQRARPEAAGPLVAPRTTTEARVAAIWEEVLGISPIGACDNFFELGGHSLLATRLISRLQDEFKLDLGLACLFKAATVESLASYIEDQVARAAGHEELPSLVPHPESRREPFPLTDVQQAYWLGRSSAFELGNVACHLYTEVSVHDLDLQRFELALDKLIARHEMLRAIILQDGRQQILATVPPYHVRVLDLRGQDSSRLTTELEAVREEMSHQVLPLERAPLLEIRATRLTDRTTRLHFSLDVLTADAWSFEILFDELARLYAEPDAALTPLDLSFRDYVLAASGLEKSETFKKAQAYWMGRLSTLPPPPELPLAVSPGSIQAPRFKRRHAEIAPQAWSRLQARAARAGITPTGILLSAFADVLTTWSKNPRFTINLTLYNRLPLHPQAHSIVGDFTSTNLLAVDQSREETFEARARRLQEQLWQDLDHRAFSGIRVLREMARAQGGAPNAAMPVIFTSTLNLGRADGAASPLARLGEIGYSVNQTPQTWLDNQVSEERGALVLNWDAVEALFPAGVLDDMFAAYCELIKRLAEEPRTWQTLERDLLPEGQRIQRSVVNGVTAPVPSGLLHEPFEAQARRRGEAPAIITSRRTLTYAQVYSRANHLARDLRTNGARPNTLVGIVMDKGWEQVVAAVAILQAGAAYLPIDASLPQERIWRLLEHGEVQQVLTQSWVDREKAWPTNVRRVCVDQEPEDTNTLSLEAIQQPQDLAYVIYTSGSTGQPKGVMIDHRGALNTCVDINTRFGITEKDRVLALSSLSFDLSVYDIFGMLAAGGAVVIPDAAAAREPGHWAELAAREKVTLWNSVPALMELLVDFLEQQEAPSSIPLRTVMMSGDWIPVSLPDRIKRVFPSASVFSLGGATEASIWSILYPIEQVAPAWTSIPYGRPMVNQTFHILNELLEPCPIWVTGQLFIGGIGLAQGYWRDSEKTAARFFTHPRTGERLYRTGDLGRYLPDGNIEFLGREDFQVKIQGYRIELGEIESVLTQHPGVRAAVVTAVGARDKSKHLAAYAVPEPGQAISPGELRSYLQGKLPDYMVPSVIMLLDSLPLSPNGKVDRRALPQVDEIPADSNRAFVAPRTPVEQTLAEIWAEDLGVPQIGIYDNVFELGGDSLIGTRAILRIRKSFHVNVPVRSLFDAPTIAEMALLVEDLILQQIEAMPESQVAPTA